MEPGIFFTWLLLAKRAALVRRGASSGREASSFGPPRRELGREAPRACYGRGPGRSPQKILRFLHFIYPSKSTFGNREQFSNHFFNNLKICIFLRKHLILHQSVTTFCNRFIESIKLLFVIGSSGIVLRP